MIITTNLTVKEMDETQDLNEARIYDRIRAVCQPVQVKGESQRKIQCLKVQDQGHLQKETLG
jgi:DNA replication protein DnaC